MMKLQKFCIALIGFAVALSSVAATTPPSTSTPDLSNATTATAVETFPNVPPPPAINANGYVVMDATSGLILAAKNPDVQMEPASLTKLMSMYVIQEALKEGKIKLTDNVTISKDAWHAGGSRMFVQVGTQVPVEQLIHGIVIVSGNDAAVAMAEYVGGTEDGFVDLMNQTAQQLGMKNSHFADVNGLPAPNHITTPRDLAILTRALIMNFPEDYKAWYSQKWFEYNNIKQPNRNKLLWLDPSVDGLKTGFTDKAGYCLVSSAVRNGTRIITVVMGAPNVKSRVDSTEALLNWGYLNFATHQIYAANQALAEPRVWFGAEKQVPVGLKNGLYVTIPNGQYPNLKAFLTVNNNLQAPITEGQAYGKVDVMLNNKPLLTAPVVALQNNPEGNLINRLSDKLVLFFKNSG